MKRSECLGLRVKVRVSRIRVIVRVIIYLSEETVAPYEVAQILPTWLSEGYRQKLLTNSQINIQTFVSSFFLLFFFGNIVSSLVMSCYLFSSFLFFLYSSFLLSSLLHALSSSWLSSPHSSLLFASRLELYFLG